MSRLRRALAAREDGASAVEYALVLAGFVAATVLVVWATFGAAKALYGSDCENVGTNGIPGAPAAC